jgi:hypothetical protein
MPYTILLTLNLSTLLHAVFLFWLWRKVQNPSPYPALTYPVAEPTAPINSDLKLL